MGPIDLKVSASDTNGALSISEYTGYTKGGSPLHIHPFQDEVFYTLEGEHLFRVGDERYHLTAGDTIFLPRNVPHAPCQLSDKGRYLYFFTPSGKMEDFCGIPHFRISRVSSTSVSRKNSAAITKYFQ